MHSNVTPLDLDVQMFLRVLIAVVLGALVGYERERAGTPAGVRTHGLVSLGAALFAVVSLHGFGVGSDTARVAAQIVSSIGFIRAGAILHDRDGVHELATYDGDYGFCAVALWISARSQRWA
jgi:putative Mg2+ transporter-C (MgtC) family protein